MTKNKDDLEIFYDTLMAGINIGEKDSDFPQAFYKAFHGGETTLIQKNIEESTKVSDDWITVIENYIPSLNNIVNNYKVQLRAESEIVNIERAKKINSQSVRQLAQNTHQIKEVRAGNKVVPKKILTTHSDIDSGLYENRFIMTLIERLFHFVRHRYDNVKDVLFNAKMRHLSFESKFPLDELDVDISFDLKMKEKGGTNKLSSENHKLFERLEYIQKVMNYLYTSQFYREISKLKKVHPPIIKTQVILKNVDYQNAYMLWLYLDKIYDEGFVSSDFKENNLNIDANYKEDLSRIALVGFSTVLQNQIDRANIYDQLKSRKYQKKKAVIDKSVQQQEVDSNYGKKALELNENFLHNLQLHFQESIKLHSENTQTYETALKRALRDMIEISNQLYESFFELGGEANVYANLILRDQSDEDKIKDAKTRVQIARMIREVKAVDYNKSIRLEKQMIKKVENADKQLLKTSQANLKETKTKLAYESRLKRDIQVQKQKYRFLQQQEKLNKAHKEQLLELRKQANEKLIAKRREIKLAESQKQKELIKQQQQKDLLFETNLKKKNEEKLAATKKKQQEEVKQQKLKQKERLDAILKK